MEDNIAILTGIFIVVAAITIFTAVCFAGSYYHHRIDVDNFQKTIANLSDEQKCVHICGFEWDSTTYLENYKFCLEKCDRISERLNAECPAQTK